MVTINHDWDESCPLQDLERAFVEYKDACYGGKILPLDQLREIRQAFLSGIHWLNCRDNYDPDEITTALKKLLVQ